MAHLIDKNAVITEIESYKNSFCDRNGYLEDSETNGLTYDTLCELEDSISTLEVKEVEDTSLEKFKSLQHITGDLHKTSEDWGYTPNLYHFDGSWHVSWISCEEGDGIKDFEGNTPEEAIDKAYKWFHSTFCDS